MKSMKHNVVVCGKNDFPEQVKNKPGWAYISIASTPECAEFWLQDKSEADHYLPDSQDVLNLNFDDLEKDKTYNGHLFKTITEEQAREIVKFVENNLHKNILIHCRAGKSRSQGVYRFILDMYPDYYEECPENLQNPCISPNMEVVRKCKRVFYETNPFVFSEVDIDEVKQIGHYVVRSYINKPIRDEVNFLLGIIDVHPDNYYVLLTNKGKFEFLSLALGLRIVPNPPINFIDSFDLEIIAKELKDLIGSFDNKINAKPIKLWKNIEEKWD